MKKTVFITGASSGFGAATARIFAANGYKIILNARRLDKLQALAQQLKEEHQTDCHILPFDVRNLSAVNAAINNLTGEWKDIDVLVNNAGLALGRDLFADANIDDWETMIDTNIKGLLYVSKAVVPMMIARKKGHIVNIGSIAGKEVYERGNVYCGTKHAVDALNKAMRIDLVQHNIKVTAIHPGAAETEFSVVRFKGDAATAKTVYDGYKPLGADDVASIIFYTASLPSHVCINDLVVTCTQQASSIHFNKNSV